MARARRGALPDRAVERPGLAAGRPAWATDRIGCRDGRRDGQPGPRIAAAAVTGGSVPARPRIITLLSRPGCHLCDDARAIIARVASEQGVTWEERDITQSQDDLLAYGEQIPVTLIDGVQHDFWRVSEDRLRAALRG